MVFTRLWRQGRTGMLMRRAVSPLTRSVRLHSKRWFLPYKRIRPLCAAASERKEDAEVEVIPCDEEIVAHHDAWLSEIGGGELRQYADTLVQSPPPPVQS